MSNLCSTHVTEREVRVLEALFEYRGMGIPTIKRIGTSG